MVARHSAAGRIIIAAIGAALAWTVPPAGATQAIEPAPGRARPSPLFEGTDSVMLRRFRSDIQFRRFLAKREAEARAREIRVRGSRVPPPPSPPPAPMAAPMAAPPPAEAAPANPEITNNQTVGVDEGGIIKQIGNYLIILQDGRLFSAELGDRPGARLRLADRINVYRSRQVAASWYDEMLVLGDRILVTAYNYRERASEITVFRLSPQGRMRREGRFLLSSNDYYSTSNYATRLVGDSLVFYAPFSLSNFNSRRLEWPVMRRADGDGDAMDPRPLLDGSRIYAPPVPVANAVLHTISVCPLRETLQCRTTAFIGTAMREFYVSPNDAYIWIGAPDGLPWTIDYGNRRRQCDRGSYVRSRYDSALLYKVPLAGGGIGAVGVSGVPADQFAFEARGGRFRALLAQTPEGCVRYDDPRTLTLLDIPIQAFDARVRHIAARAYRPLPAINGNTLKNRFIGDWLVYGGAASQRGSNPPPATSRVFAVPLASRDAMVVPLTLDHGAIRIERAGNNAIVTGYGASPGLSLSMIALGTAPRVASTTLLAGRYESEGRSHAFNATIAADGSGVIGIPTRGQPSRRGWSDSGQSELSFLRFDADYRLAPLGELSFGRERQPTGYSCEVSCIDWYGNSRPIFTGGRILALMGTDLVEGRITGGRIEAIARLDLTATPARADP